jgi:PmbA protein
MERSTIDDVLQREFDEYEVAFIEDTSKKYEVRDRELYGIDLKTEKGMSLRAVKDNRLVFSYTFAEGEDGLRELLKNAKDLLPVMEPDESCGFPPWSGNGPTLPIFDGDGLAINREEKVARLLEMEATILDYDKRIEKTRNCEYSESELFFRIVNSRGIDVQERKTIYTAFGLAVAKEEDEVSYYDWIWSHAFGELDFSVLAKTIAERTLSHLGGSQIPTGIYDGMLTPRAATDLLQVLSASFLAESRYKNKTTLKEKEGQQCFSHLISVVDSGIAGIDAFPFDGEGVPSRENYLVERGIFTDFVYDTYYGRKFGKASTGNAARTGLAAPPHNSVRGIYIANGDTDLAGSFSDGLIIDDLMGVHTANPITGEFSLGAVGWRRKDGEERAINGVIFSGSIFELLQHVKTVGNDLRFYGSAGSPSLYIEGLRISGT